PRKRHRVLKDECTLQKSVDNPTANSARSALARQRLLPTSKKSCKAANGNTAPFTRKNCNGSGRLSRKAARQRSQSLRSNWDSGCAFTRRDSARYSTSGLGTANGVSSTTLSASLFFRLAVAGRASCDDSR